MSTLHSCNPVFVIGLWATFIVTAASGATHYVWQESPTPAEPFASWATAAKSIQEAVDAAAAGDEIVVTNGVYAGGGRVAGQTAATNRLVIDKPVRVRSANGPQFTILEGYQTPGTTNGDNAIRCAYLAGGSFLAGFTLRNGATPGYEYGGGVWCESRTAVVSNCILTANSAYYGGGGYGGTLLNCALIGNFAIFGGGASGATLIGCTLVDNRASRDGGGAYNCARLASCVFTGNQAVTGGGACGCLLANCTLTGNAAQAEGGGVYSGWVTNSIIYYNTARSDPNYYRSHLLYCCTAPQPPDGSGNFGAEPELASASHLSAVSPCRGAGSPIATAGNDIDGEAWSTFPAVGCDESMAGTLTGKLNVKIDATWTRAGVGYPVQFRALIDGKPSASAWDFGDGIVVSNRPFASHAWATPGSYTVKLCAWNESAATGTSSSIVVEVMETAHYVSPLSPTPAWPFATWTTAARTIQEAVDAATLPGAVVLVTNGLYSTGGRAVDGIMTNRVVIDKPVIVRSVNGPETTLIEGHQVATTNGEGAVRCVYVGEGAILSGFTLRNGATLDAGNWETERSGGGAWCAQWNSVLTNCILFHNTASQDGGGAFGGRLDNCTLAWNRAGGPAGWGGGAARSTLSHCLVSSNQAYVGGGVCIGTLRNCLVLGNMGGYAGGGVKDGVVQNCTIVANSADWGGGVAESVIRNSIVFDNSGSTEAQANYYGYDEWQPVFLEYCCTLPLPRGHGNFTNAPRFQNVSAGNFRLRDDSPCINAGFNAFAPGTTDLDGLPRVMRGTIDCGAYEVQAPSSAVAYAWLQRFGLPADTFTDSSDPDGDGFTNWQEWKCGTDPLNAASHLQMLPFKPNIAGLLVPWTSSPGLRYVLERSTNKSGAITFLPVATNTAQGDMAAYLERDCERSRSFYRVRLAD